MINDLAVILAMRARILLTGQVTDAGFFGYNDTIPDDAARPYILEHWDGGEEKPFTNMTTRKKAVMTYWIVGIPGQGVRPLLELAYAVSGCFALLGDKAVIRITDTAGETEAAITSVGMGVTDQPGRIRIAIALDINHTAG